MLDQPIVWWSIWRCAWSQWVFFGLDLSAWSKWGVNKDTSKEKNKYKLNNDISSSIKEFNTTSYFTCVAQSLQLVFPSGTYSLESGRIPYCIEFLYYKMIQLWIWNLGAVEGLISRERNHLEINSTIWLGRMSSCEACFGGGQIDLSPSQCSLVKHGEGKNSNVIVLPLWYVLD